MSFALRRLVASAPRHVRAVPTARTFSAVPYAVGPQDDAESAAKCERLANTILSLNVIEVNQFLTLLYKRGYYPAYEHHKEYANSGGGAAVKASSEAEAEPVKEQTEFTVKLAAVDASSKIKVIKEVRTATGLGLKEAKELVEKAPVNLKDGLTKEDAEALKTALVAAGATIEIV